MLDAVEDVLGPDILVWGTSLFVKDAHDPGEISLHNIRTVHASEPNRSDDRRIGVAVRYIAPHVEQINAPSDSAWLVRGEDRYGHFVLETPPEQDMDAAARAEHARIMQFRQGVLYKDVAKDVAGKPAHL